ncbi:hypothetical protein O181_019617 [Austropuccinia psidii MF-1]|uniref:Uncharacterized protein n=1 Tax=Austropuccinia psidii MF-1 TaxID=1389203 RepID=A0A9Q3CA31_9BASI|nr:hypothetical protein [Austropuccinia psidii MF-1]
MTPPLLRDIGFQRNKLEQWPRRHRGRRQPITIPNYQQGTHSQGLIQDKNQPRSLTRGSDRCRAGHDSSLNPGIPLCMEYGQNHFQYESIRSRSGNNNQEDLSQPIAWIDLMKEVKGWNPNKNFKLSEESVTIIKETQAAIQAIRKLWNMEKPSQI